MPVTHEDCAPYLSAILCVVQVNAAPTIAQVRSAILAEARRIPAAGPILSRRIANVPNPTFAQGQTMVGWLRYTEIRRPAWYVGNDLEEERQQAAFALIKGDVLAITFTDPAFRNSVAGAIRKATDGAFAKLRLMPQKQVGDAFVGSGVRTIWLSGAHHRTTTKADSKVLSGLELESALDPLEDQTYYFSSVRSQVPIPTDMDADARPVVGANPRNARVWLGPTTDWGDFAARTEALINAAAHTIAVPRTTPSSLSLLAQPLGTLPNAREPYDMAVFFPEAAPIGDEDADDAGWLHDFRDAARFELHSIEGTSAVEATIFWGDDEYGRLRYEFSAAADTIETSVQVVAWDSEKPHADDILRYCRNPDLLTIYYDTGHTFARGVFYETRFRDAPFKAWKWVRLNNIRVDAEKPLAGRKLLVPNIGGENDTSLFGFVARHWPNIENHGQPGGWLACDDGSMESADFIHFDNNGDGPNLTLIHVKGSGSSSANRGVSVTDYEVVVSQAVKNLRYLDRGNIGEKLTSTKNNQIGTAVWHNGVRQQNRDALIELLNQAGSSMKKTVVVLQPSVRRVDHEATRALAQQGATIDRVRRLQQLDALLLSARTECYGLGADFYVVGQDDRP
ncbi:hypothetical protein [Mesorhizobium sp.]|uniref:hypothetical protein n=1 Tax=Mesorhizobium sp. TaxID=1871066 RepID=UPI000FE672C2|nr:hypothetical protein [Mesorhizobium sp.]RWP58169.1 MAG: hypothetical protein EOR08_28025 [Mesorhizobium sp.]